MDTHTQRRGGREGGLTDNQKNERTKTECKIAG